MSANDEALRTMAFEAVLLAARHTGVDDKIISEVDSVFRSGSDVVAEIVSRIHVYQEPLLEIAGKIEGLLHEGYDVAAEQTQTHRTANRRLEATEALLEAFNPMLLEAACGALYQTKGALDLGVGEYGPLKALVEKAIGAHP